MLISAREDLRSRQKEKQLSATLKSNQYNLVHMNASEFVDYIVSLKKLAGQSPGKIINWFETVFEKNNISSDLWPLYRDWIKNSSGLIPIGMDIVAVTAIATEMKRSGKAFDTFKVKSYSGKNYIIFKGYPGLRRHLTGTRYLANNPQLVSFGIGKLGAKKSIKTGFLVSILISAGFHTVEQLVNDEKLWHDFIGGFSVDVAIAATSSSIAWYAVSSIVGTAAVVAVGPMIAVIVIGTALTFFAYTFIDSDELSEKIASSLRVAEKNLKSNIQRAQNQFHDAQRLYEESPIEFMHRIFGLPFLK